MTDNNPRPTEAPAHTSDKTQESHKHEEASSEKKLLQSVNESRKESETSSDRGSQNQSGLQGKDLKDGALVGALNHVGEDLSRSMRSILRDAGIGPMISGPVEKGVNESINEFLLKNKDGLKQQEQTLGQLAMGASAQDVPAEHGDATNGPKHTGASSSPGDRTGRGYVVEPGSEIQTGPMKPGDQTKGESIAKPGNETQTGSTSHDDGTNGNENKQGSALERAMHEALSPTMTELGHAVTDTLRNELKLPSALKKLGEMEADIFKRIGDTTKQIVKDICSGIEELGSELGHELSHPREVGIGRPASEPFSAPFNKPGTEGQSEIDPGLLKTQAWGSWAQNTGENSGRHGAAPDGQWMHNPRGTEEPHKSIDGTRQWQVWRNENGHATGAQSPHGKMRWSSSFPEGYSKPEQYDVHETLPESEGGAVKDYRFVPAPDGSGNYIRENPDGTSYDDPPKEFEVHTEKNAALTYKDLESGESVTLNANGSRVESREGRIHDVYSDGRHIHCKYEGDSQDPQEIDINPPGQILRKEMEVPGVAPVYSVYNSDGTPQTGSISVGSLSLNKQAMAQMNSNGQLEVYSPEGGIYPFTSNPGTDIDRYGYSAVRYDTDGSTETSHKVAHAGLMSPFEPWTLFDTDSEDWHPVPRNN